MTELCPRFDGRPGWTYLPPDANTRRGSVTGDDVNATQHGAGFLRTVVAALARGLSGGMRLGAAVVAAGGAVLCLLPVAGAAPVTSPPPSLAPCDIYVLSGTPCTAAYSTTRAMYAYYRGPLYEIQRASDGASVAITTLTDGDADAAEQTRFCADTTCVITELFDQSPDHNDLSIEGPGTNGGQDRGVPAGALPISLGGHSAYGMLFSPQMGYRDDSTVGMATGADPESIYMVTSGTHTNASCCFDFGNAETNDRDNGNGHMNAIYFGSDCWLETDRCPAGGPWVQADLENGIFASSNGLNQDPAYAGSASPFVTAMLENNGTSAFALDAANAQSGPVSSLWSGALPVSPLDPDPPETIEPIPDNPEQTETVNPLLSGYAPMRLEGAVVLGTGGDNTSDGVGSFFEGAIVSGVPTAAAEAAVQRNIVHAGYASAPGRSVSDVPALAVSTRGRGAVAAVRCQVTCTAHMVIRLTGLSAQTLHTPLRVLSVHQTLAGTTQLHLLVPARLIARARHAGLPRLTGRVTVQAAGSLPASVAASAQRSAPLVITL